MPTLTELYERAESDLAAGRFDAALAAYLGVMQGAPRFLRARFRVADVLLNLSDRKAAKEVYKALAWYYIRSGHPLLGLVAAKMVLALDPGYEDILPIIAELYSSESDRVGDIELFDVPELPEPNPAPPPLPLSGPTLWERAAAVAANTEAISEPRAQLPMIPLFSHLSEEAFIQVLGSLRLRRCGDGERVITEGEMGDSFFMLADGVVRVSKNVGGQETVLANLQRGSVFGEMALVSNAPRTATVTAAGEVALLGLSRSDLEHHAGQLGSITEALRRFTRGRFLANLAATSPLFQDLEKDERRALLKEFQSMQVHPGDALIEEGETGRGLFLVLRGDFDVNRREGRASTKLATLKSGDVFGEISLIRDAPTSASVVATSPGEVLFLPRTEFTAALKRHPEVHATLMELTAERLRLNRQKPETRGRIATQDDEILV
jgi:cAMP-dependent protein kinase regulator